LLLVVVKLFFRQIFFAPSIFFLLAQVRLNESLFDEQAVVFGLLVVSFCEQVALQNLEHAPALRAAELEFPLQGVRA